MANPSTYYQWEFPQPGDDPWYGKIDRLISSIDVSVHSLEALLRSLYHTTVVWSLSVGNAPTFNRWTAGDVIQPDGIYRNLVWVTSDSTLPAAGSSFVVSLFPVGQLIGQFTVPASGVRMRLRMTAPLFPTLHNITVLNGDYGNVGGAGIDGGVVAYYRLVDGTQVNTINMFGDSLWKHEYRTRGRHDYPLFTAVVSLEPGTYTVELQSRRYFFPNSATLGANQHSGIWALYATVEL